MTWAERLSRGLQEQERAGLYRSRRVTEGQQSPHQTIDGNPCLSFCSNDYLGLAAHAEVAHAFRSAVDEYGAGSGASHLITGHSRAHQRLEEQLAEFTGRPRALLFSTGYMANLGVLSALCRGNDQILQDRLNHASLIDAALGCRAKLMRYPHRDYDKLADELTRGWAGNALIVTDGVFSMDGDLADLIRLRDLAADHNAWLMVDDAHGFGVLGAQGKGIVEHFGLLDSNCPEVLMCTLGKAVGTFGAFVAGSEALIETLIQRARTYVYTTALPPALAAATSASLLVLQREGWRREKLFRLIERFRSGAGQLGLSLLPSATPIQPLLTGSSEAALAISEQLSEQGILVPAIRPPTVPRGGARLRITLSAAHEEQDVDRLLSALDARMVRNGS